MNVRSSLAVLSAALVLVPFAAQAPPAHGESVPSLLSGNRSVAPSFRVRSLDGKTLTLGELRGHGPVLLDFWATWCKPCVAALPELEALHQTYRERGLTVVGVSIDGPRNFAKVRPFVARARLTYPIVLDENGDLQESFRVVAVPTAILVARDGTIARVQQGYRPGESAGLARAIEAELGIAAADSSDSTSQAP